MLSVDQVAAFVALAEHGSIRAAAGTLYLTEQGARGRLLALEAALGARLYRKGQGRRTRTLLTEEGLRFLPRAKEFLVRAEELGRTFSADAPAQTVHVAASAYLTIYVLIDVVRRFHAKHPDIRIRLASRSEREIEAALLETPLFAMGVAAPWEPSADLEYSHQFSMDWSLIVPPGHPLARRRSLDLRDAAGLPLILFEPGSTGRQHILEAFRRRGLAPRVEMEATTTEVIVRMVEAGLGAGIVPLLPRGVVTRGRRVAVLSLGKQIREIQSGILTRRGERPSAAAARFIEFVKRSGAG
jgi:DNA-binding transcriptional LysR family regulator